VSLSTWLTFCVTETVLCLMPGPAVLLVLSTAAGRGARAGLGAALGILAANTVYFALSATGVVAAHAASRDLFVAIQWVGAAYLIWIGLRMLRPHHTHRTSTEPVVLTHPFVRGFVVQIANPKAVVFFAALLPQFINPAIPVPGQILILGATSLAIELSVLGGYAHAAVHARNLVGVRVAGALHWLGGGLLIALGVRLAILGA
jgi:threonine/homoserine/homoserine lactone efflux protein